MTLNSYISFFVLSGSYCFYRAFEQDTYSTLLFTAGYSLQCLWWAWLFQRYQKLSPYPLIVGLCLSTVLCVGSVPILEDDYFRYFWDGYRGTIDSPYLLPPAEFGESAHSEILARVNFPSYRTVYPPATQLLFQSLYTITGGSLSAFLLLLSLGGSVFCLVALWRLLRLHGLPTQWSLWFLAHPLVLKETIQSYHFDLWGGGFLLAAFCQRKAWIAGLLISVASQIRPFFLLGLIVADWKSPRFWLGLALGGLVCWLPYWQSFPEFWEANFVFGREWEMNSGLFRLLRSGFDLYFPPDLAMPFAKLTVAILWGAIAWLSVSSNRLKKEEKLFWILFLLPLIGPVANPWYFLWAMPLLFFLPFEQQKLIWLCLSFIPLSYSFYTGYPSWFEWLWTVEHIGIWGVIALILFKSKPVVELFQFIRIFRKSASEQH